MKSCSRIADHFFRILPCFLVNYSDSFCDIQNGMTLGGQNISCKKLSDITPRHPLFYISHSYVGCPKKMCLCSIKKFLKDIRLVVLYLNMRLFFGQFYGIKAIFLGTPDATLGSQPRFVSLFAVHAASLQF